MAGFLFHDIIFGPVRSRRLGLSLGINLLPSHRKHCSFNCIYCECGWTPVPSDQMLLFPDRKLVSMFLEQRLKEMVEEDYLPDALTFAGNGEPTLHPEFPGIVDDTITLRDKYTPAAKVTVLSNASMIHDPKIFQSLLKLDNNILKLDAGSERMFRLMNKPVLSVNFYDLIRNLKKFEGKVIIQSMFLRGYFKDQLVDNTTEVEVDEWLKQVIEINPKLVMIYPIARATPVHSLEKIPLYELEEIAKKVRDAGLKVQVYG
jgi:wyosine [tRNA(Phe)-imidazoG37] synthetase (radical SAM superfamily)